jgi:hypothetical protein
MKRAPNTMMGSNFLGSSFFILVLVRSFMITETGDAEVRAVQQYIAFFLLLRELSKGCRMRGLIILDDTVYAKSMRLERREAIYEMQSEWGEHICWGETASSVARATTYSKG